MTFLYLPGSIDTIFLVVYEPHRVLEDLHGVGFQGKTSQKWPQTSPKYIYFFCSNQLNLSKYTRLEQ